MAPRLASSRAVARPTLAADPVTMAVFPDMFTQYGDHYIAVNEAGDLRSKPPMWQPDRPYHEAYQRPINAGIENGHIVFFIHGGGNDVSGVIDRIQRFSDEFRAEP